MCCDVIIKFHNKSYLYRYLGMQQKKKKKNCCFQKMWKWRNAYNVSYAWETETTKYVNGQLHYVSSAITDMKFTRKNVGMLVICWTVLDYSQTQLNFIFAIELTFVQSTINYNPNSTTLCQKHFYQVIKCLIMSSPFSQTLSYHSQILMNFIFNSQAFLILNFFRLSIEIFFYFKKNDCHYRYK